MENNHNNNGILFDVILSIVFTSSETSETSRIHATGMLYEEKFNITSKQHLVYKQIFMFNIQKLLPMRNGDPLAWIKKERHTRL